MPTGHIDISKNFPSKSLCSGNLLLFFLVVVVGCVCVCACAKLSLFYKWDSKRLRNTPDVVLTAGGRVLVQTQGSLHFVYCPLSTPPKHLQKWDSQRLLLGVRWPQGGCNKMLSQPLSPLDFCLSLQSGPSLLPVQLLTRQMWQSPCPSSLRGVLVPSTCPDPLGPVCCRLSILPALRPP